MDVALEQPRPVLVGNAQGIAEAGGHDQQDRLAGALEQSVGGHRGPHLHHGYALRGNRGVGGQAEQTPDSGHGGVTIVLGIVGQQLRGPHALVGADGDDVGEGAAAIDPELPVALRGLGGLRDGRCRQRIHGVGFA